jgi:hypothetical protein
MHLKVFLKLKKLSLLGPYIKKPKKPKKNQKTQKKQKDPLGCYFFLNPGFFQSCLVVLAVHAPEALDHLLAELHGRRQRLGVPSQDVPEVYVDQLTAP